MSNKKRDIPEPDVNPNINPNINSESELIANKNENIQISELVNPELKTPELSNKRLKITFSDESTPYAQYEKLQQKFKEIQQFHIELQIKQKFQQIQKLQSQLLYLHPSAEYVNTVLDVHGKTFTNFISNNIEKVLLGNQSNKPTNYANPTDLPEYNRDELIEKYHTYSAKLSDLFIEYKKNVVLCNEAWNSLMITSTLDYNFQIFMDKFDIMKTCSQIIPELANQCDHYIQMIKQIREIIQADNLRFSSPLNPIIIDSASIVAELNALEQFRSK